MTDRLVAFLDVLGCRSIALNGTDQEKANIFAFLKRVNNTYLSRQGVIVRNIGGAQQIIHNPEVFACSDSVLLSVKVSDPTEFDQSQIITNLMSTMISIYWQGVHAGLLVRGGVARGECIHQENQIFGEAYVKAVDLEKITEYPRIQFDKSVFNESLPPILDDNLRKLCTEEIGDQVFLNCLGWHHGVWVDYLHFKYGTSEWPRDCESEIRQAVADIEANISAQIGKLHGTALAKWEWFREQWEEKKLRWPIFAQPIHQHELAR